jgi:single-strand DNA-binding protein
MLNFSQTIIAGNLTRNPEVKTFDSGNTVVNCTVALNESFKDSKGEPQKRTSFIDVQIWGKNGETFAKYHSKGTSVFIVGTLRQDTWEDKDGNKRSKIYVSADSWQFNQGPKNGGGSNPMDVVNLILGLGLNKAQQAKLKTLLSQDKAESKTEVPQTDVEHSPFNG